MTQSAESEFEFELRVCAWAERNWPPGGQHDPDTMAIVARQLGTKHRRWDTVIVEASREKLETRARFGSTRLDSDLLGVVRHAPTEWTWYRDALPEPDYPWRYVREAVHRAADRGILETRQQGNRIELRRKWTYPDWVERVIAIENKPDLTASAARALAGQIEHDVALGLADEVWVATAATDDAIEPVLLEDFPVEAGVLVLGGGSTDDDASVAWHPRTLAVDKPGTRITERPTGGTHDQSAARFEYASPEWKRDKRLAIAERAYERGWRSYVDTMRPDCRHFELRRDARNGNRDVLPWCAAKERRQTAAECAGSCSAFEPEPPGWRAAGWPIEGGPGSAVKRLLARRRDRRRPDATE
ncbi:DUF5787 family protein [Halococcus salifodinae]|uniref:Uncharacterized protein n=1 Tax=Halococcus salifodinae DSM 8989 TaxID=1227456 RepID=M0MX99_9EURY|nr:DUF5787 family protein [Halococcus salifodinae]EMA49454.1 hypothetical protein C450_17187 [Halococcus salifodinae DSM 8989]